MPNLWRAAPVGPMPERMADTRDHAPRRAAVYTLQAPEELDTAGDTIHAPSDRSRARRPSPRDRGASTSGRAHQRRPWSSGDRLPDMRGTAPGSSSTHKAMARQAARQRRPGMKRPRGAGRQETAAPGSRIDRPSGRDARPT